MKRLLIGCVIAFLAIAFILVQLLQSYPLERLRPILESELSEAIGLKVHIAGSPELRLTPEIKLSVEGVRIENLPHRHSPYLLEVERLSVEPSLLPLLRRTLVIQSLELYGAALRIEPDAEGNWALNPNLEEIDERDDEHPDDPFKLRMRELTIYGLDIFYDRFNETDVTTAHVERFRARAAGRHRPIRLEGEGRFEGGEFEVDVVTGSFAEWLEPSEPFPLDLRASLREGHIQAVGKLGHPRTLEGMALRFDLQIADLANGAREFGLSVPSLGAVEIGGMIVERSGLVGIEDLVVKSRGDSALELDFEGVIRDLSNLEGVDVQVRMAAADADLFRQITKLDLSGVPMEVDLELEDADGSLGISGEGEVSRPGRFALEVEGGFGDLYELKDLDVRVGFETTTIASIVDTFDERLAERLPRVGPLNAKGRFVLENGRLGLAEIDISLGDGEMLQANLTGSIKDIRTARGVILDGEIHAKSASQVASLFDRRIPEVGALEAAFTVRDADGTLGIESASIEVGGGDDFALRLTGAFDDLLELDEGRFEASLTARDLSTLGEFFELELPQVGPVSFSGDVIGSRSQFLSQGRLELNHTIIHGAFETHAQEGERRRTVLRLSSPSLHIPDLFADDRVSGLPRKAREKNPFDLEEWWSGDQLLPFDVLHSFDAELLFEADRVTGYDLLDLRDFKVTARLEDGQFSIDHLGADYEGGKVSGLMAVDARPVTPKIALKLETFNIDMTKLMSQFQAGTEYAGFLDLSVRLDTQGSRASEIRGNLDGVFGAMLREGMIVNKYSRALTFDVLRVSIPAFGDTPDSEKPVQCLLALFPISNGIAEIETLYLEGKKITIDGTGQIDLVRDEIAVRLTPKLHEPGLVSVAATVDVTGPIEHPKVEPIRRSMVTSALGAVYQNAKRPVDAIRKLIGGRRVDAAELPDACGAIVQQRVTQMLTEDFEPIDLDAAAKPDPSEQDQQS